ncbi:MAG: protein kinase [Polyangiaceae bacterium]
MELSVGSKLSDDFTLTDELAPHPLAQRFLADSVQYQEAVELRVLRAQYASHKEAIERFKREAELSQRLVAPHLIRGLSSGELEDGRPYMVIEHIPGEPLDQYLERHGQLALSNAAELVLQAAEALGYAHRAGVVHRDVAPRNMVVSEDPLRLHVANFDVARVAMSALTSQEQALGTPTYMAPEQIQASRSVDERADVWGLGIMLHELLTGHIPFEASNLTGLVLSVLNDPPELSRDLPSEVAAVIRRCLEKQPSRRFANMAQLSAALRAAVPSAPGARAAAPQAFEAPPARDAAAFFVSPQNHATQNRAPSQHPAPPQAAPHIPPMPTSPVPIMPAPRPVASPVPHSPAPPMPVVSPVPFPSQAQVPMPEPALVQPARVGSAPIPQPVQPASAGWPSSPPPPPAQVQSQRTERTLPIGKDSEELQRQLEAATRGNLKQTAMVGDVAPGFAAPAQPPAATAPAAAAPAAAASAVVEPAAEGAAPQLTLFEFAMLCAEIAVAPREAKNHVLQKYNLTEMQRHNLMGDYRERLATNPEEYAQWKQQYESATRHWRKIYGGEV